MTDFFALLGLNPVFDISIKVLESAYIKAQQLYHPDRMVGKSPEEKTKAALLSTQINEAYATLKSDLKRAQYILGQNGIRVGSEEDSIKPTQELLLTILDIREQISEAESPETLDNLATQVESDTREILSDLSQAFTQNDLPNAAQLTIRLGYLQKCLEDIRIQKKNTHLRTA